MNTVYSGSFFSINVITSIKILNFVSQIWHESSFFKTKYEPKLPSPNRFFFFIDVEDVSGIYKAHSFAVGHTTFEAGNGFFLDRLNLYICIYIYINIC